MQIIMAEAVEVLCLVRREPCNDFRGHRLAFIAECLQYGLNIAKVSYGARAALASGFALHRGVRSRGKTSSMASSPCRA